MKSICRLASIVVILTLCSTLNAQTLDEVEFGNPESELAHSFRDPDGQTQTVAGQFGHSPRQIKAPTSEAWNGGSMQVPSPISWSSRTPSSLSSIPKKARSSL